MLLFIYLFLVHSLSDKYLDYFPLGLLNIRLLWSLTYKSWFGNYSLVRFKGPIASVVQLWESLFSHPQRCDLLCFLHHRKSHSIFGVNLSRGASRMRNRSLQAPKPSLLPILLSTSHTVKTLSSLKRRKKKSKLLCFCAKPVFLNRLTHQGSCQQGHCSLQRPVGGDCRAGCRSEGDQERNMGWGDYEIPFRDIWVPILGISVCT